MSYGKARAPLVFETPTSFLARDDFVAHGAGAITGKTAPTGGVWAGGGDADDFQVNTSADTIERSASSDTEWMAGRVIWLPTSAVGGITTGEFKVDGFPAGGQSVNQGVVARLDSSTSFLFAFLGTSAEISNQLLYVYKRVAGVNSALMLPLSLTRPAAGTWQSISLGADAAGRWAVWAYLAGAEPNQPAKVGQDANLVSGALADGYSGIYDSNTGTGLTRSYRNFRLAPYVERAAIFSTQSARFLHDIALRENAAGTSEGRVPVFQGKHLTCPPATRAARKSRIVVSARRFDVDSGLPDSGTADNLTGTLTATPRVLLVNG